MEGNGTRAAAPNSTSMAHARGRSMRIASCVYLIGLLTVIPCGPTTSYGPIGGAFAEPRGDASGGAGGVVGGESRITARRDELDSVLGREVRTSADRDLGRIIDVLVDRGGGVQAVVIEFGGFLGIGTRKIAVDWSALRFHRGGDKTG